MSEALKRLNIRQIGAVESTGLVSDLDVAATVTWGHRPGLEVNAMKTRQIGRNALTGRIIPVASAKANKAEAVVETVKVPTKRKRWVGGGVVLVGTGRRLFISRIESFRESLNLRSRALAPGGVAAACLS